MKISNSYNLKGIQSVGVGLTNQCNLNCPHCYSRSLPIQSMSVKDAGDVLNAFPEMEKVNFGTGESVLNPDLIEIMQLFKDRGIKMALTTNGLTALSLDTKYLSWFSDIDISVDFPQRKMHDKWRAEGSFDQAMMALQRCKKIGVNVAIALCLMNCNYQYLAGFRKILDRFDINLRINIYKPTPLDKYSLEYDQFWKAIEILAGNFKLTASSEPILSLIGANKIDGSPCGDESVRIHPDGTCSPCVFLAGKGFTPSEFSKMKKKIPAFCQSCRIVDHCRGGCISRRILRNRLTLPDEFCPLYRGKPIPKTRFTKGKSGKDFIHQGYLCTLIVE